MTQRRNKVIYYLDFLIFKLIFYRLLHDKFKMNQKYSRNQQSIQHNLYKMFLYKNIIIVKNIESCG
jgi:hypothetical protein